MEKTETNFEGQEEMPFRKAMADSARQFKSNWVRFGSSLTKVASEKLYEPWGFGTFEDYCREEIKIRKATAMKLTSAFFFLSQEEPAYLQNPNALTPDLDAISVLQKAREKGNLSEDDFADLKENVFEKGLSGSTLSRQYKKLSDLGKEENQGEIRNKALSLTEKLKMELMRLQHEEDKEIPFDFEGHLNQISQYLVNRLD